MKLGEIAKRLDCTLEGDPEIEIQGVASIELAQAGQLTFVAPGVPTAVGRLPGRPSGMDTYLRGVFPRIFPCTRRRTAVYSSLRKTIVERRRWPMAFPLVGEEPCGQACSDPTYPGRRPSAPLTG